MPLGKARSPSALCPCILWVNSRADWFFNLVCVTNLEWKHWIQTNSTPLKYWPCVTPSPGLTGKCIYVFLKSFKYPPLLTDTHTHTYTHIQTLTQFTHTYTGQIHTPWLPNGMWILGYRHELNIFKYFQDQHWSVSFRSGLPTWKIKIKTLLILRPTSWECFFFLILYIKYYQFYCILKKMGAPFQLMK